MMIWIAIAAGGAIGAVSRYAATLLIVALMGTGWQPLATLAVNVIGCGLMGIVYGLLTTEITNLNDSSITNLNDSSIIHLDAPTRLFIQAGFLGALTTFSAFALDAINLFERGAIALAAAYVAGSVILSLAGFIIGLMAIRMIATGH